MSPDDDDDRTVIRPPGSTSMPPVPPVSPHPAPAPFPETAFQRTEWSAGQTRATPAPGGDRTELVPPPPPAPPDDMGGHLPVGTRLGEFEITAFVGEGGFGVVYRAHDHSLQRRVALKEYMPSSLAQRAGGAGGSQVVVKSERYRETFEAGLKSFINEARLLASFDHPSLVKVYRFWEANGTAYMVMPFLEGTTLKDVLKSLAAPPDEAWLRSVLGPLTEALQVIHAEQCYHRDIAPDNVMLLSGSNRWLLLDFGAARRVIGDMTQALTVILKPGYAPVEQYAEIPGMKQGPWTDVYALAAVVYFAIMGRTPPPSVGRLLNDTYVPLSKAAEGRYSAPFLAAIDRALAVRPEERTQSIGELRQDLGLGPGVSDSTFDAYTTKPLAGDSGVPPRRDGATQGAARGMAPTQAMTPAAARAGRAGPAERSPGAAPAPGAGGTRKGAIVGIGAGVVALLALGIGGYALLAPKPRATVEAPPVATPAPAPVAQTPAPAPAPAPAPVAAAPATFDVQEQFGRVVRAQTPGFDVHLDTNRSSYRIGRDELKFTVRSDREGFVYVFGHGADNVLIQLYPKATSGALKIGKGQTLALPQGQDRFLPEGPAGPTDLLVMVSARQRDHSAMRPRTDAGYRTFPTGAEAAALAAAIPPNQTPMAGKAVCPTAEPNCADEYGAALVRVEIVP
jgi:serine/threonine protein kinase